MKLVACYNVFHFYIQEWTVLFFPTYFFNLPDMPVVPLRFYAPSEETVSPGNCISQQAAVQILSKGEVSHGFWKFVNHYCGTKQVSLFSRTSMFMCICFPRKKLHFILKIFFSHLVGSGTNYTFNTHRLVKHIYTRALMRSKTLQ